MAAEPRRICAEKGRASESVLSLDMDFRFAVSRSLRAHVLSYTSDDCLNFIVMALRLFFKDGMKRQHGDD